MRIAMKLSILRSKIFRRKIFDLRIDIFGSSWRPRQIM